MAPDKKNSPHDKIPVAVALQYDGSEAPAPRITATGRGAIAEQIIALARRNNIEVHEDATLAELLSTLDIDSFIPAEAFAAVAEILSYVYRQDRNLAEARGIK
ncbi:MAG: flagellar protein FhlB [Alphaproteobacteria bacterium]|mgnify:CR=1 FL=1|jgi:flagellar biosynthesis protein|nr:flagellar protein FhlB [Alphaproteobacteria bacterium]